MDVKHRLTGHRSVVPPDVVPLRLVLGVEHLLGAFQERERRRPLRIIQIKDGLAVPAGNDNAGSDQYRLRLLNKPAELVFEHDRLAINLFGLAERTLGHASGSL